MDELVFAQAAALRPQAFPDWEAALTKPSQFYIAIRRHDWPFNPEEEPGAGRYVWIKARQSLRVSTILDAYRAQCPGIDVVLKTSSDVPPLSPTVIMSELPIPNRLLVLFAAPAINEPRRLDSSFSSPSQASPRPPLQSINRQVTYPLTQSPAALRSISKSKGQGFTSAPAAASPYSSIVNSDNVDTSTILAPVKTEATADLPDPFQSAHAAPTSPPTSMPSEYATPVSDQSRDPEHVAPTAALQEESQVEPLADSRHAEDRMPRDHGDLLVSNRDEEHKISIAHGVSLLQLSSETSPERLEAGVATGLRVLDDLAVPLRELGPNHDARTWLEQIEAVRKEAVKTRTVVGVVGNTGAGKSSVINAMLEEERLVPTNCMRACTAVVTELSWNNLSNPNASYRAEIEFIQAEDWRKELHVLYKEVFDEGGNFSKEISTPDSEASVAYAKIRAVYNKHTREMLQESTPDKLMSVAHVQKVLGQTKKLSHKDPTVFYRLLQQYVDSKEKGMEKRDKNGRIIPLRNRPFELWPLIKVVKIYTKAEALSTGACIVDLPGVHDSNAARAAVAEGYMKQCTGLWIVAPITRAVDDKAAKTLLGDTFKRQLQLDGSFNAVTFICSKTDDISRMEASDSLGLHDKMDDLDESMADLLERKRVATRQLRQAKDSKEDHESAMEQIEEQMEKWEDLEKDVEDGKTVYAPSEKKRKRHDPSSPNKRRRKNTSIDLNDDEDCQESQRGAENESDSDESSSRTPLTEKIVAEKLAELRQMKKDMRREKRDLDSRIAELKDKISEFEEQAGDFDAQKSALCIAGRNEYSRGAIQQDFAAGIRELDQENAYDENPNEFDPNDEIRDYDEVAKSLPVFCVSSRAYQKLSGRLKKDSDVPGFTDKLQTEMPQLQAHCKKLTEKGRQATCRRFLNSLRQLLSSLTLWSSDDGSGIQTIVRERDAEERFLNDKLAELEKALEKSVSNILEDASESLNEQLFSKFQPAVQSAIDQSISTATGWGARKDEGGLLWQTYKATVRRNGVYHGASGPRDFNAELTEPIYKQLASAWEKAFQRRLPHILKSFQASAFNGLKKFHDAILDLVYSKGLSIARINHCGQQLQAYKEMFGDLASRAVEALNESQRKLNREFTPVIAQAMESVYNSCAEENGPGQFNRMKHQISAHVSQHRGQMFQNASDQVRMGIQALCKKIQDDMLFKADEAFLSLKRDYSIVVGIQYNGEIKMSREERAARRQVSEAVDGADQIFSEVLQTQMEDLKREYGQQEDGQDDVADEEDDFLAGDVEIEADEPADEKEDASEAGEQSGGDDAGPDDDDDGASYHDD